jgi:hypothetical protein
VIALPILIALFAIIVVAYYGIVRGWLFKGIFLVAGSIAIWIVLADQKQFQGEAFRIGTTGFSWAAAIPIALVVLVMLTTRERD